MYNVAPVTNGLTDDSKMQQIQIVSKWSELWRNLILSSLDKTFHPYCRYIRALDLRNLKYLFEDPTFQTRFTDAFFADELAQFRKESDIPYKPRGRTKRVGRLNIIATLEAIGEAITKASPLIEELDGEVTSAALLRWLPRLPRLQQLTLWDGGALESGVGDLIRIHCPDFKVLRYYLWPAPEADSLFAEFLQNLRPQSLETFEVFSSSNLDARSFLALNCHGSSLRELKIENIKSEAMPALSLMKGCIALTSLYFSESTASTDLENNQNDTFLELIAWLRECKNIESITFKKILSGPALLTPILLEHNIKLVNLEVTDYLSSKAKNFHQALVHQQTLRSISLKGEGEDCDVDVLVNSLSRLPRLTELRLSNVSDFFRDEHICKLARNLTLLEDLSVTGWGITDGIWADVALLQSLRRFDMNAWTMFTADGLLEYISNLGLGNWGLSLAVSMADPESALSEEEQALVQEALTSKVDGRFDYTLTRGNS